MRAICVDDDELILELTVSMCNKQPCIDETVGFTDSAKALEWVRENTLDVAFLDIDMTGMDGITLAGKIKEIRPDVDIIFLTGHKEYALDAFSLHASGYMLKPVSADKFDREVSYIISRRLPEQKPSHIAIVTFGKFDVYVDGNLVSFSRSKAKELLAYLVDMKGSGITRAEAFDVLWEEGIYDRSMQKQLDVIIRSLRTTLEKYGISEIFETENGVMRVIPEKYDCDLCKFIHGDKETIASYRGEYMSSYAWADMTAAYLDQQRQNLNL